MTVVGVATAGGSTRRFFSSSKTRARVFWFVAFMQHAVVPRAGPPGFSATSKDACIGMTAGVRKGRWRGSPRAAPVAAVEATFVNGRGAVDRSAMATRGAADSARAKRHLRRIRAITAGRYAFARSAAVISAVVWQLVGLGGVAAVCPIPGCSLTFPSSGSDAYATGVFVCCTQRCVVLTAALGGVWWCSQWTSSDPAGSPTGTSCPRLRGCAQRPRRLDS